MGVFTSGAAATCPIGLDFPTTLDSGLTKPGKAFVDYTKNLSVRLVSIEETAVVEVRTLVLKTQHRTNYLN